MGLKSYIMKKKVFSVLAVVMFMSTSLNVSASAIIIDNDSHEAACAAYAKKYSKRIAHMQILSEEDEQRVYDVLYGNCINQ
jgi:hypothetical protein